MKLKICEICQQAKFLSKDKIEEGICKRAIRKYAYILHDKDPYTEEDEKKNSAHKAGALKPAHWHICLQFRDTQDTKYIAKWFGIEEQYVGKSKSGKFEDMALYLIHKKASGKYQYSAQDVVASFDYNSFIENNGMLKSRIQEITDKIVDGTIREFNYPEYIDVNEYVKYAPQIEKAFKYRRDAQTSQDRKLDVIFITGGSGLGKTTLAKHIAKEKGFSYAISGSDNDPFENYKGEDCFILDDLRGSSMKFSELVKILDNNTNSLVKSRYHNKDLFECKLIIITSIYSMQDFYANVFAESDEPLLQLQRRCKFFIYINSNEYYSAYYFNKEIDKYELCGTYRNIARDYIINTENTKYDSVDMLNFLGARPYIKLDLSKPKPKPIGNNDCPF